MDIFFILNYNTVRKKKEGEQMEEIIKERLKSTLSEKRYNHSLAVMQRCEELAKIYGEDVEKARLIGLAHDVAKEMKIDEVMKFIQEKQIQFDETEMKNPGLWHAKIGARICKDEFGFTQDMVQAVENHTTAKAGMDVLSQILFVADATGLDREWNDLDEYRKLSEENLLETVIRIIELNINRNIQKRKQIHPRSITARNAFLELVK